MAVMTFQFTGYLIVCSTSFHLVATKWIPKLRINCSFSGGFPSQRASNRESDCMAWRHHDKFRFDTSRMYPNRFITGTWSMNEPFPVKQHPHLGWFFCEKVWNTYFHFLSYVNTGDVKNIWNSSSWKARNLYPTLVNTLLTYGLETQVAGASAVTSLL